MTSGTVLSVDVMGGDRGPEDLVKALGYVAKKQDDISYIVHGDADRIAPLLSKNSDLVGRVDLRHCDAVVPMDLKPSRAIRVGQSSSLAMALRSVANGEAASALSAGNTGAIVALSMFLVKRTPLVERPAIAVHWPASSRNDYNVVLDMGADVRADARSLVQYAVMGSLYHRAAFGSDLPRVGLLNVGSEDFKGRPELHEARGMIEAISQSPDAPFSCVGYVEGTDIGRDAADVIVTDGFTGNIAMKAAEGTASFARARLRDSLSGSFLARAGAVLARPALRAMQRRIDPRQVNGGVLLGLQGTIVKSHGSADAVGHAAALRLAATVARNETPKRVSTELAALDVKGLSGGRLDTTDGTHS